jgi:hypothetical protein
MIKYHPHDTGTIGATDYGVQAIILIVSNCVNLFVIYKINLCVFLPSVYKYLKDTDYR